MQALAQEASAFKVNQNTFNSDGRIQGVVAGKDDTDAVNVGQLNKVVAAGDTDVHIKAGEYKVDDKNKVAMNLVDKAGNNEGTVTITGVAKAEDVAVVYVDNNKNKSLHTTNSGAVESNAIALGKGASAHENSVVIGDGAYTQKGNFWTGSGYSVALGNNAVTGTKSTSVGYKAIGGRVGTITVGYNSYNGAAYGTVIGTESKINYSDQKTANAAATIVGAQSEIIADNKPYSGVANGIFGSANKIQNSNGVTIQGSGNTVTNAYKDMSGSGFNLGGVSVKKDAGAVGVIGGMNTVSNQIYTNVIGFGNTVAGDADNISHDVFLAGSRNNLSNVSDSIVMGNENAITGVSNVISFGHQNTISANNAVAIGNGAGVSVEGGVALGVGSVASTDAGALGYGAAEGETGIAWQATNGAVSVGSSVEGKKITRQITNVAAGTEDTDAVNVAQLKTAKTEVKAGTNITSVDKTTGANGQDIYTINAKDTTYAAGNGIAINGENNAISVKLKEGENNLEVTADGLALKKDLTVNSVAAGDFYMSTAGVGYGDKAYITSNGLNANNQKISGVAAGEANTDAVNVSQLNAVKETANKGWKLSTGKGEAVNVAPGETVDFSGDDNIKVSNTGKDVKVELKKNLTGLTSVTTNNAYVTNVDASNNKSVTNVEYVKKQIAGVTLTEGNGISITDKKINVKLKDGEENLKVDETGLYLRKDLTGMESITGVGDGKISFATGGNVTINNITFNKDGRIQGVVAGTEDTDAVNVAQLKTAKTEVKAGTNITSVDKTTGANGQDIYTINAKDTTYAAGNGIAINGENNAISVKLKEGENNLEVTADGLALKKDLTVNSVAAGDFYMSTAGVGYGDKAYITSNGLNANNQKISGVAAGEANTDAVNVSQLNAVKETANKGWKLSTGKGEAVNVAPGETVDFSGDDNIVVSNTGKNVVVKLGKELTGLTSVTTNNAYVTKVDASKNESVTNVEYVNNQIAGVTLTEGKGISITDKKINVKLKDGEENLKVDETGLYLRKDLTGMESITGVGGGNISFSGGNVTINKITFNNDGRIQNVANGTENTDAVNFGQLQAVKNELIASDKDTHIDTSKEYNVGANNQIKLDVLDKDGKKLDQQVVINDVAKASDVGDVSKIADDLKNGGNKPTTVVDAVNNLNNKVGDLNYVEGGKGNYVTNGENTTTSIGKLDKALKDVADTAAKQHTTVSGSGNIVVEDPTTNTDGGKNYNVKLADDITVNSVTANTFKADQTVMDKYGLKVGDKVSVTATAVTAGKTSISDEGVKVGDKTYISADGLNANGQHITNVKAGEADTDAVNYGQLKDTNNRIDGVENQVISNTNRINQLGNRVNKVGAGAAALAALHPMDFDPDDKLTFSAGYGNYGGENAAAIGAYYRPDEKVMFSVAGTVGNGENMVNAGVSFALDRTNHVSNSRTALAREVIDLRGQLAVMGAKMAKMEKALGMLDETKTKLFPDIPANHWAYEYIAKLAGNGYIEGYPDGNFGGDRLMTRYEFAAMLYRAIENGAALEEKIIKEFEPELGRIRVDRISGEDGDRDKIERVRVNDTKGERDHYGNKVAK